MQRGDPARRRATTWRPHGVAYVSYNTYPGWHMREMRPAHDALSRRAVRRHPPSRSSRRVPCWTFSTRPSTRPGPTVSCWRENSSDCGSVPTRTSTTSTWSRRTRRSTSTSSSSAPSSGGLAIPGGGGRQRHAGVGVGRRGGRRRSSESVPTCCISSSTWTSCATACSGRRCLPRGAPAEAGADARVHVRPAGVVTLDDRGGAGPGHAGPGGVLQRSTAGRGDAAGVEGGVHAAGRGVAAGRGGRRTLRVGPRPCRAVSRRHARDRAPGGR